MLPCNASGHLKQIYIYLYIYIIFFFLYRMFYIYVVLVISISILYCIYAPCYPIATQLHVLLSHTPTPHSTYQCITVICYRSIFSFFIPVVSLRTMYSCRVCPKFQYSIIFVIIAHYEVGYTILTNKYYNGTN